MNLRNHAWLWLVVAVQVAIPASYYLRDAGRDDERFAWRMFSAVRVKRCSVRVQERREAGWTTVPLGGLLHSSWQSQLERGRKRVIAHVLDLRCALHGVRQVELTRRCRDADGVRLRPETHSRACIQGGVPSPSGEVAQ